MKTIKLYLLAVLLSECPVLFSQNAESKLEIKDYYFYTKQAQAAESPLKTTAIDSFRQQLFKQSKSNVDISLENVLSLLQKDGTFSDLDDQDVGKTSNGNDADSGGAVTEAFKRIWCIAGAFKTDKLTMEHDKDIWEKSLESIIHYGMLEISRSNDWTRFHSSCFAIPTAAVNIYFNLLPQMDRIEQGKLKNNRLTAACDMLKTVALQAWTRPLRNDSTDKNVVQLNRFRNHTWWVGGNALGYRPLLPVAFMFRSIPMLDLLVEICQKCINITSQNTYNNSFWNEGFTADGAGWGHGKQCLIWGYPIDGTFAALNILGQFQGTPWEQKLSKENVGALMNFFRGGNYYYYKGFTTPCLDRNSMNYTLSAQTIPYRKMLSLLLKYWRDSFTSAELQELELLYEETGENNIQMDGYNLYNGTRWFFNNDDLVKKNKDCYVMVNMASIRCDGIESACGFADAYNFYTTDGTTLFQKDGNEYRSIFGGFDVTAMPGVTAREGMDRLAPVTNWRGYTSKHNFAAASTFGDENAVAGYIFEKLNASEKEGVNDRGNNIGENSVLYGVKAYKSYFMLGDYLVALGAGITNLYPEQVGHIRTTIDQTSQVDSIYLYRGKGIEWIIQKGKFAYSVLPQFKEKMYYVCETKKTDWVKMNKANKAKNNLPEKVDIFRMWIDHGQKPVNDTYGYVVYTGNDKPASEYPFRIMRNDTLIQCVQSKDNKVTGIVFYHPETLKLGKTEISVSAPCTLLLEQEVGSRYKVSVTDAEMNRDLKEIWLNVNGKQIPVVMPQDELCGKPAVCSMIID